MKQTTYGPNLPNVGIVENELELTIPAQYSPYIAYGIIFEVRRQNSTAAEEVAKLRRC